MNPRALLLLAGVAVVVLLAAAAKAERTEPLPSPPPDPEPLPVPEPVDVPASDVVTMPSQDQILDAIRKGEAEYEWIPLPGYPGIEVMGDALKVGGLRVPVSARTAQMAADLLGASLSTALLEDAIYQSADLRTIPKPQEINRPESTNSAAFSADLDRQIAAQGGAAGKIVSSVGKAWVLDDQMAAHPTRAFNYGMHSPTANLRAVTQGLKVYQDLGWAHNIDHHDYSQTLRLVRVRPGTALPGVTRVTRQPGVAPPINA